MGHSLSIWQPRSSRSLLVALLACVAWSIAPDAAAQGSTLVESSWLQQRLGDASIQVIDVRSREDYQAGHIDQAISLPVDATFDSGERDGLLGGVSVVRDQLRRAGIRDDRQLVLYDDGSYIHAARMFWVLEVFGHEHVAILNIGYPAWQQLGLPTSDQATRLPESDFTPKIQPKRMATALTTRVATKNPRVLVLDARTEDEFLGRVTKAARAGRIPGAQSVPWSSNIEEGAYGPRLKPLATLAPMYRDIVGDQSVIAYCNKGKQSALTYFVLRSLGYDVAAYDGSWHEWGNSAHLPIESGDPQPAAP